jgi:hypothetical protein
MQNLLKKTPQISDFVAHDSSTKNRLLITKMKTDANIGDSKYKLECGNALKLKLILEKEFLKDTITDDEIKLSQEDWIVVNYTNTIQNRTKEAFSKDSVKETIYSKHNIAGYIQSINLKSKKFRIFDKLDKIFIDVLYDNMVVKNNCIYLTMFATFLKYGNHRISIRHFNNTTSTQQNIEGCMVFITCDEFNKLQTSLNNRFEEHQKSRYRDTYEYQPKDRIIVYYIPRDILIIKVCLITHINIKDNTFTISHNNDTPINKNFYELCIGDYEKYEKLHNIGVTPCLPCKIDEQSPAHQANQSYSRQRSSR